MSSDGSTEDSSLATFTTALVFNVALGAVFYLLFTACYPRNRSVYSPKAYAVPPAERSPALPSNPIATIRQLFATPPPTFIQLAGLDAYVFVRYLEVAAMLFSIFTLIALPVLLPLNLVGQDSRLGGLDQFTIGNVQSTLRLYAHALLACLFIAVTVYVFFRELVRITKIRQKYMASPGYATSLRGRTMLVTGLPKHYMHHTHPDRVAKLFAPYGTVEHVQHVPASGKVLTRALQRDGAALNLEIAECALISEGKRPTMRTGMPCFGSTVDAIDHYKSEFARFNNKHKQALRDALPSDADHASENLKKHAPPAAFVTFSRQSEMQTAVQSVLGRTPWRMTERWPDVAPTDIIWENLRVHDPSRYLRVLISLVLSFGLIIIWSGLTAFVASIATLDNLTGLLPFLNPVRDFPAVVVGIIQGLLPAIALAILMFLLPIVLKMFCRLEGIPLMSELQLSLMHKYYAFLIVNVLLVVTLASGFLSALKQLKELANDPGSALSILAEFMPKASTFFLTYVLLNTFTTSGQLVLQIAKVVINWLFGRFLTKTPRAVWILASRLDQVEWGIVFPPQVLMFAIGILYSAIQPIVLPFIAMYFILFAFAYRYLFLYVYSKYGGPAPYKYTLLGRAFPRAVLHTFVALYIFELTMLGLFVLKKVVGPAVIMGVALILTIMANRYVDSRFTGVGKYLASEAMTYRPRHTYDDAKQPAVVPSTSIEAANTEETTAETHNNRPAASSSTSFSSSARSSVYDEPIIAQQELRTAYLHPAFHEPAPTIWLPHDAGGVAETEVTTLNQIEGLSATTEGATITDGKINIDPEHVPITSVN